MKTSSPSTSTLPAPAPDSASGLDTGAASTLLAEATGAVPYNMTNDYMFRAVLQSSNKALRGLVCSLLRLSDGEAVSVEIQNGIILGEAIEDKEFRLDILVRLNGRTLVNLEMQVTNRLNWRERSVSYLCRAFDQLRHGQGYQKAVPVIHIGFLDYALFPERPEFYATYQLLNVRTHEKFSDSLTLSVVDLSHVNLASAEDQKHHIDDWARLFKAATWEEIKMLASKDQYLQEAAGAIFSLSEDDLIRKRCRDREDYYQDIRNYELALAEKDSALEEQRSALAEKDFALAEKDSALAEMSSTIAELQAEIMRLKEAQQ